MQKPAAHRTEKPLFVALLGDFDAGPHAQLARTLARAGLCVLAPDAPDVTHLVHGARSTRLASLLGGPVDALPSGLTPALPRTHWAERDLDALVRSRLGHALADPRFDDDAPAPAPAHEAPPAHEAFDPARAALARSVSDALASPDTPLARLAALARSISDAPPADPAFDPARAALLRDPRVHDARAREALCRALTLRASPFALQALAEAVARASRPSRGDAEARSFAALVARGVTRFATPTAPFALEYETPTSTSSSLSGSSGSSGSSAAALDAIARRVGPVELLSHAAHRTSRVRIATLPAPLPLPPLDTLVALFAEAKARPRARVYLAGCALPAALPRATWAALLRPLCVS